MRPVAVHSANVRELMYDYGTGRLHVWFNAAPNVEYIYHGVPSSLFIDLLKAASVGSTFHRVIRSQPTTYPYEKVIYLEY